MKSIIFKNLCLFTLIAGLTIVTSCEVDTVVDPNNPSLASVTRNADKSQLQGLVTGLEARHRGYLTNAVQMFGTFGREVFPYFASDQRFTEDWLGLRRTTTYPDFFGAGGTYTTPFVAVKQANVLIEAAQNSTALTEAERKGYQGFAKTIMGFQMLWPLMQQYQNGIRIDVKDPLNPGPFVSYKQALTAIRQILEDGANDLKSAGATFSFTLSAGFNGFNTPPNMLRVNRAIAARVALYDEDWQGALAALQDSFLDLAVTASTSSKMDLGPKHVFGEAPDVNNPLFYPLDLPTNTILIVHPALIEDALPGDLRVTNKFARRVNNPAQYATLRRADGSLILGEWQDKRWPTNITAFTFIRNEELILINAEVNARLNRTADAVNAINVVRTTWGLAPYAGATDTESLINEILFQRRYSLWAEGGHRWIDLRRTNRLNSSFIDLRDQGNIFTQVDRPTAETNWDKR